ncbi:MAG TPA: tetratricopeptide repeat protein [Nannocystaceae bacterium]|nr:tetratricopeptide repeat protein [Nannocystaceae bacterium]
MRDTRLDPQTGRAAVVLTALLGASAVIGYAATTGRTHPEVTAPAGHAQGATLPDLTAAAAAARDSLDVDRLSRLAAELSRNAESTTLAAKSTGAQLELLDVQAALALEASVRAEVDEAGREAAQHSAARAIASARELSIALERKHADPGRIEAAMARAELAAGTDITESFPAVLMPTYRDPELRLAALAAPVWRPRDAVPEPALLDEIIAQLQGAERQTTLVKLMTAAALRNAGRDIDARSIVADVLQEVPQQPLARALQRSLGGAAVAVAPQPSEPETPVRSEGIEAPEIAPTPTKVEEKPVAPPKPTKAAEPKPKPDPEPEAEPEPTAVPEPTPKPDPDPVEAKAPPVADDPDKPKPDAATKKKGYDALLSEGCKLVRSGKADQGFELLKQAFDLNPNAVAVTVCMAEAHHELGRDASARALCDRALRKSPNDRRALLLAAELELARGNESAALAHYKKILENHPDDAKAKAYVESHGG